MAGRAQEQHVPTQRELQLVIRVIGLQDRPPSAVLHLGVVFDPAQQKSAREAQAISNDLKGGPQLGFDLYPLLIDQASLRQVGKLDAILAASGVSSDLLRPALLRLQVPCLTFDRNQLGPGGCMVSVEDAPTVTIVLDQANALAANIHFATAFRMMVNER